MPPSGYLSVTSSDELTQRPVEIIDRHKRNSYVEAIEWAEHITPAQETELSTGELDDMFAHQIE